MESLTKTIAFGGKSHWATEMENTTDAGLIYIARNGHIMGRYYEEGIRKGFACGFFLPTDLGWEQGLAAWLLLTEIVDLPTVAGGENIPVAQGALYERQPGAILRLTLKPVEEPELMLVPEVAR